MKKLLILLTFIVNCVNCELIIYPTPPGVDQSDKFKINLHQDDFPAQNSFIFISRSNNRIGQSSSVKPNRTVSWTSFAFTGSPVVATVLAAQDFKQCIVRPKRYGIGCRKTGSNTATFNITENTVTMSVEFDYDYGSFKSDIVDKLLIFADAPEDDVPDPTDPGVLFYGSEAYNLKGQLQLNDSIRQVYLAPGAFVEGGLRTMSLKPIKISGRGILSGANYPHKDPGFLWSIINVDNGMNHTVEGITMVDPPQFFFRGLGDNNVVRNVKTVGPWTHNTDGVGIGSGGLIEDSFFQTNDDTFKVYNDGLVARRCVVWQGQNGAVFQFGWWVDRLLNNVSIDTIDVIHTDWCTFKGEVCHSSGNDAVMDLAGKTTLLNTSNINITNVRLEGDCPRIFNFVMDTKATGIVKDVYLNNWVLDGLTAHTDMDNELGGSRQGGRLSSWLINNMTIAEKCITRPSQANVKIDPKTTNNIKFSCG